MELLKPDDVYSSIGQFGFIQKIYMLLIGGMQIFVAFHMVLNIFTGMSIQLCFYLAIENYIDRILCIVSVDYVAN